MQKKHLYTTQEEQDNMRLVAYIAAQALEEIERHSKPGVSTEEIDNLIEQWVLKHNNCIPTFKGYLGFPKSICVAINQQVVHGIPSPSQILKEGDLFSFDIGITMTIDGQDYVGDNAKSIMIGDINKANPKHVKLIDNTRRALQAGCNQCIVGNKISDIAKAIEDIQNECKYGSVREFGGHGIGPKYHCAPFIPNYTQFFQEYSDDVIEEGMVLAVEPMFTLGLSDIRKLKDNWTIVTRDNKFACHYEYSILVLESGSELITTTSPLDRIKSKYNELFS